MKAFLLAGGYGTRLRPLTLTTPKCLVPVGGRPLLEHWLMQLVEAGCHEILINTHYLATQVEEFIAQSPFKKYVTLTHEKDLLGTLGSLRENYHWLQGSDVVVAHADNFCLTNWDDFITIHNNRPGSCEMTMMLFETDTPSSCGMVSTNKQGIMTSYIEKPENHQGDNLANAAVFLIGQNAMAKIASAPRSWSDLCKDFIPHETGHVMTYKNEGVLIDIGSPSKLEAANDVARHLVP